MTPDLIIISGFSRIWLNKDKSNSVSSTITVFPNLLCLNYYFNYFHYY